MTRYAIVLLILACSLIGNAKTWDYEPSEVRIVLAAEYFNPCSLHWKTEVERRYDDAILLLVHGNTGPDGEWWAYPQYEAPLPMRHLVARIRLLNPGKRIVLVACNPGDLKLDIRNITYARENVWMFPDRNSATNMDAMDRRKNPFDKQTGGCGSIFEFVENK